MDELMIRFVYNMHRNQKMKDFELAQSKLAIKIKEKGKDKPQNER